MSSAWSRMPIQRTERSILTFPPRTTEQRKLAVIMFTDVVDYSAKTQQNEQLTLELLAEHRALVRPLFSKYGGREIKTIGDAFMAEFNSALQAVRCAVEIQRLLLERNAALPEEKRIEIRIGLHLGDVVLESDDVLGDGVNIAARIQPLAAISHQLQTASLDRAM